MDSVGRNLRQVVRKLTRSPLYTTLAVLTLALGIGGSTAVFTVVNGVLLNPLAFEDAERLVGVWHTAPGLNFDRLSQSPAIYLTYREESQSFEDIGLWNPTQATVTGLDEPQRVPGMLVTDGTLPLLGVRPHLGRLFSAEDDSPGTAETVILSHGYWQSHHGGDPGVIGRNLMVDGVSRQIIGVLPPDLHFLDFDPQLFLPYRLDRAELFFGNFAHRCVARLRAGVTIDQASEELERLIWVTTEKFPLPDGFTLEMAREARLGPALNPLRQDVVGDVGNVLWVLLGTVSLVLLVACANVANLFLVRAEGRQQELAVRAAMGASRAQLGREFLLESVVLGLVGGFVGLWLAWTGIRFFVGLKPEGLPRLDEISIDANVLLFTVCVSVVAGLLFGLFPAFKFRTVNLVTALKEGGRGGSSGRERHWARNALVVSQMAMALVLLVGSGLMMRSFVALRGVHPGFERPEELLTLRVNIPAGEIEDVAETARTHELILRALEQIPGAESVGASTSITMDETNSYDPIFVEEFPTEREQIPPLRCFKWIMPGYFETMGNPVLAGRSLTWADIHDRAKVVVVTESFAREYWGDPAAALGKRIRQAPNDPWREIVGVVANVHDQGLDQEATDVVFWPVVLEGFWGSEIWSPRSMSYVIRSPRVGAASLLTEVRQAVWSVNSNLPLANVQTVDEILGRSMARTSFTMTMLGIAAAVALLLGTVGIYGVTSYAVTQRTREIGVRMALGARQGDVIRLVLQHGLVLALLGVLAGTAAAVGLTRLMSALLYGVSPVDPMTYGAVAIALAAISLLASFLPARRAAGVDPIEALRWE
jgi:predicted permease